MTEALKKWLVTNCGVKVDAMDDEFTKAAGNALANGTLPVEDYAKMTEEKEKKEANEFVKKLDTIADSMGKLVTLLTPKEEKKEEKKEEAEKGEKSKEKKETKTETKEKKMSNLAKMIAGMGGTPTEIDGKDIDVRVKEAAEMYSTTKSAMHYPSDVISRKGSTRRHPLAGQRMIDFTDYGRPLDTASERDKAIAGAYSKFIINRAVMKGNRRFGFEGLPQHDKELLYYAMENENWNIWQGEDNYADKSRKLLPHEQKALIDDAISGGLEAAPIVFDDQVIETPLLYGELFPQVNTIPLDRGRRIEGVAAGTVTGSWGGVDDTAISLFNTASYVSAFDTTIYRWQGAVRIGLDFLSDSPIDFGAHFTRQYGERLLEDLDDVIATGNGTTQPEGIMNKTGTTSVAFGGATTIGAYETLRFSVAKNEHGANVKGSAVFCGTETSYQRAMAIPVGASDARRLSQTVTMPNYDGYRWMERPYKINESLTNSQIFYAILARYRMYRRRGFYVRTSTEGDTLIRANELLIVAMARYGGQLERGACASITTTAPA